MRCPHCARTIPADATYCIYCAGQVHPTTAPTYEPVEPATGATVRLDPLPPVVTAPQPVPSPRLSPRTTARSQRRLARQNRRAQGHDASGAIFILGLVLLFVTGTFWPGILLLIGVTQYVKHGARGQGNHALGDLLFFGGLALLFWTNTFWPGIVVLLIVTHLLRQSRFTWGL